MLASLASIYEEQGVLREHALALHDSCADCNHCWKGDEYSIGAGGTIDPDAPAGENGSIFWPWIGRDYATGGVCLVGLNLHHDWKWWSPMLEEFVISSNTRAELEKGRRTGNINKCQLKPLNRSSYPALLTDADFARLQATFPAGVCDWSKRGVDQRRTLPWRAYDDSRGGVRYGGRSLGVPAARSGSGWSANVFADPSESMPGSAARR